MRILALCGSLQAESANLSLLRVAATKVPADVEIVVFDGLRALPHFDPDLEKPDVPESVSRWRRALADNDALLIASPEYGHSLPGALKNAIAWVIGSGELESKLVAVTASTPGPGRGVRGLEALLVTLGAVRARIVGGTPIVRGPTFEQEVAHLVEALVAAVRE